MPRATGAGGAPVDFRRNAANQQQLGQIVEWSVLGDIRPGQVQIIIAFGAVHVRIGVRIAPVLNGIQDRGRVQTVNTHPVQRLLQHLPVGEVDVYLAFQIDDFDGEHASAQGNVFQGNVRQQVVRPAGAARPFLVQRVETRFAGNVQLLRQHVTREFHTGPSEPLQFAFRTDVSRQFCFHFHGIGEAGRQHAQNDDHHHHDDQRDAARPRRNDNFHLGRFNRRFGF